MFTFILTDRADESTTNLKHFLAEDQNVYCQMILKHLFHVFVSHPQENPTDRQDICRYVVENVEKLLGKWNNKILNRATHESVLQFFLSAANVLLAPPAIPGGI